MKGHLLLRDTLSWIQECPQEGYRNLMSLFMNLILSHIQLVQIWFFRVETQQFYFTRHDDSQKFVDKCSGELVQCVVAPMKERNYTHPMVSHDCGNF